MEALGMLGLVLGVFFIIFFALRKLTITIAAPLAAIIILVFNRMDVIESLLGSENSFMTGLADFIVNNFAVFLLGAVLGSLMEHSKATITISQAILKWTGTDSPYKVMAGIAFITALLSYGGISSFIIVFALFPMVRPIFKVLDINWSLVYIPFYLGGCTFVGSMLPGSPAVKNYIPSRVLGTPLTAGADIGLIATAVALSFGLLYMKYALNKSQKNGEGYASYLKEGEQDLIDQVEVEEADTLFKPRLIRSLTPILVLLSLIFIFKQHEDIIIISLVASIVVAMIIFNKFIPSQFVALNNASNNAISSTFKVACSNGFGLVLISTPAFGLLQNVIRSIPGSPLIGLSVLTSSLSAMMGTGIGPTEIVLEHFIQDYLAMGYHPELLHRIVTISAGIFSCMPHTGMVITTNQFSGLSYHNAFKHAFIIVNGCHFVALVAVLLVGPILY